MLTKILSSMVKDMTIHNTYSFYKGYAEVEKDGGRFYVKKEEFEKTGSSRRYGNTAYIEGFNVVYENGKCYFIDENGKLYGEGFDWVNNFREGFAEVQKNGRWYFIDKDFKLYGEGYDRVSNFGKGVVSVVNAGRQYFTKLIPGKALKVYGNGFIYDLNFLEGRGYRSYRSYYQNNNIIDDVKGYFSWKEMESKDYLNLAKEDPTYCICIPEEEFSDKFVKKLGNIASKYYEKKIKNSDSEDYNKIEQEMKFVQETIQTKQEEYRKIQAEEQAENAKIEQQQESLLKAAKAMFAGDAKSVGNEVLKQAPAESQQKVEEPKTTEPKVKVAKAEKPVEKKPAEEQSAETEKKQGAEDGAIREVSDRLQKYYQILLYTTRKATENEKNAIKNYIDKNKDIIASDEILSKLSGQILPLCDSEQGEENE